MWYLVSQYWHWMLLALALGVVIGWLTWGGERKGWGWLPIGLALAFALWLVSYLRLINGIPALWLESGLLLFISYLAGCWLGGWLHGVLEPLPLPAVALAQPAPVAAPARVVEAAPPLPLPPAAMPKLADEGHYAGKRPPGLVAPRDGKADDLKWIRGIGKQNEGRLHGLGIWHFDQIAGWTKTNVDWVGAYLAFPGRIEREEWVKQAKALAAGKETAFSKRAKWGLVASSRDDGTLGQGNVATLTADKQPAKSGKGKLPPKPRGK